ncbi:unnamed protein product [Ilex paraguariensis]|uniref:Uncharacterized protein n=1 Tax=Ilex paraguariensis TaxID=185542 RepID=A0ABC8SXZ9_9AQUA
MEWLYPKRRGPEWKQGWTRRTMASVSAPPLPLLAILAIVIFLLSLSQYTGYKQQLQHSMINFQLSLFLVPIMLMVFMSFCFNGGMLFNFWSSHPRQQDSLHRTGGSAWGVAVLLVVVLVLVSYQSSFHSKWFAHN